MPAEPLRIVVPSSPQAPTRSPRTRAGARVVILDDRATARLQTLSPSQEEEFKAVTASLKRARTRIDVAAGKFM